MALESPEAACSGFFFQSGNISDLISVVTAGRDRMSLSLQDIQEKTDTLS